MVVLGTTATPQIIRAVVAREGKSKHLIASLASVEFEAHVNSIVLVTNGPRGCSKLVVSPRIRGVDCHLSQECNTSIACWSTPLPTLLGTLLSKHPYILSISTSSGCLAMHAQMPTSLL